MAVRTVDAIAMSLTGALTPPRFDLDQATQEAEILYQEGVQLVNSVVRGSSLTFKDDVTSVVTELDKYVAWDKTQGKVSFHGSLCKAYRIFVELTWFQRLPSSGLEERPILTKTRDSIISNSGQIAGLLTDHVYSEFEYSCAGAAATCLTPADGIWQKYLATGGVGVGAAATKSVGGVLTALKDLILDGMKDSTAGWYPHVWELRWEATSIRNIDDINLFISPILKKFKEEGAEYTICLAVVWKDLIKNPGLPEDARNLAVRELCSLMYLKDENRLERLLSFLSTLPRLNDIKLLERAAMKVDRYYRTHILTMHYLDELIRDDSYRSYHVDTSTALVYRSGQATHVKEKETLRPMLEAVEQRRREEMRRIADAREILQDTFGDEVDPAEKEAAEQDLREGGEEKAKMERQLAELLVDLMNIQEEDYLRKMRVSQ